jgi:hypothetical protein
VGRLFAMRRRNLWALAAALGVFLPASPADALYPRPTPPPAPADGARADLSGIWRIDWSQSDPRPRLDGSTFAPRAPRERRSEAGGSEGSPRARSLDPEDGVPGWARDRLTIQTLIIFQEGRRIEISVDGHRVQRVEVGTGLRDSAVVEDAASRVEGRWEESHLVLTSVLKDRATLTETFVLKPGGRELDVVSRILTGPGGPLIVMNRVYRKYTGA